MKILVALDGSDCSRSVIDHCLGSVFDEDTQLKLISVVDFFEPLPALEGIKEAEIESARKHLVKEAGRLMERFPSLNVSYRVLDGYIKSKIMEEARDWRADLIMLGSHGRRGIEKLLLGSISLAILNHAAIPVRVVRKGDSAEGNFEVMLCMDDSRYSREALERVLSYSWPSYCRFSLVSVIFPLPDAPNAPDSQRFQLEDRKRKYQQDAERILSQAESRIKDKFGEKTEVVKLVESGDARDRILAVARERKPTLILMGSHGRGAFDRALMGSVSEAVVNLAETSVEIVR